MSLRVRGPEAGSNATGLQRGWGHTAPRPRRPRGPGRGARCRRRLRRGDSRLASRRRRTPRRAPPTTVLASPARRRRRRHRRRRLLLLLLRRCCCCRRRRVARGPCTPTRCTPRVARRAGEARRTRPTRRARAPVRRRPPRAATRPRPCPRPRPPARASRASAPLREPPPRTSKRAQPAPPGGARSAARSRGQRARRGLRRIGCAQRLRMKVGAARPSRGGSRRGGAGAGAGLASHQLRDRVPVLQKHPRLPAEARHPLHARPPPRQRRAPARRRVALAALAGARRIRVRSRMQQVHAPVGAARKKVPVGLAARGGPVQRGACQWRRGVASGENTRRQRAASAAPNIQTATFRNVAVYKPQRFETLRFV